MDARTPAFNQSSDRTVSWLFPAHPVPARADIDSAISQAKSMLVGGFARVKVVELEDQGGGPRGYVRGYR
jgi:hypothetical protein